MTNRRKSSQRPARSRRGSVYMLVLGMGVLLTVVGLAVAMTGRINVLNATADRNLSEADSLASSAVDLAVATVNSDTQWRTTRGNDAWSTPISLSNGVITWKQTDEIDSVIDNDPDQQVRLSGDATVGDAGRRFSILASPRGTSPLSVLSCTLHSEANITVAAALSSSGGAVSCDGVLSNSSTITGNVETASVVNTGSIVGFVTTPSRNKSVPGADVFAEYQARATEISFWSTGGIIDSTILSSSSNPYGSKSASGTYFIRVPTGQRLRIGDSIIQATLVIELQGTAQLIIRNRVAWEPPSSGVPALVASGPATSSVTVMPDAGTVSIPLMGANVLGIIVVLGTRGTAPSELHGLFHIMGGAPTSFQLSPKLIGTWIGDGAITISSVTQLVADSNLAATPPHGYTSIDATVTAVPGTFRWEER